VVGCHRKQFWSLNVIQLAGGSVGAISLTGEERETG
jgi:hypothetical protein